MSERERLADFRVGVLCLQRPPHKGACGLKLCEMAAGRRSARAAAEDSVRPSRVLGRWILVTHEAAALAGSQTRGLLPHEAKAMA